RQRRAGIPMNATAPGCALNISSDRAVWQTLPRRCAAGEFMAMPNFNIYLGAYASWLDSTAAKSGNPDERYGARVRFKYFF
ncbi:carbohydrate porin, partial [Escherichia coli]|uniref:carbohydrate porin n=1 Tax=Escherichia coli TaxID=562 RepID=UPI00207B10B2